MKTRTRTSRTLAATLRRLPWPALMYWFTVILYAPSPLIGVERGLRSTGALEPFLRLLAALGAGNGRSRPGSRVWEGFVVNYTPVIDEVGLD